mgnify:CR=1 FL=1
MEKDQQIKETEKEISEVVGLSKAKKITDFYIAK